MSSLQELEKEYRELLKEYRELERDIQRRDYRITAYERQLKKELDPDAPEWDETFNKLAALEDEQNEKATERLHLRAETRNAYEIYFEEKRRIEREEKRLYYEKLRAERGAEL